MEKLFKNILSGNVGSKLVEGKNNVLAFGCTHIPFEKEGYLDFLLKVKKEYNCNKFIHLGDEVDNHATSFHEHDPDGMSAGKEIDIARRHLKDWYKAFPQCFVCIGNHSALPLRKARAHGLSKEFFRTYREIWQAPDSWYWDESVEIDGVLYQHGLGSSGINAHRSLALNNMQSTVIAHHHSNAGVEYIASHDKLIFGMAVGCGVDRKSYAMAYGKHFPRKPIIGCGVVIEGKYAKFIPMEMG